MARRRKRENFVDVMVFLPWQISAGMACASFVAMRWIVPSVFAGNPFLAGLAALSQSMAWLPFVGFGFIGLVAFGRSKVPFVKDPGTNAIRSKKVLRVEPTTFAQQPKFDAAWGQSDAPRSEHASTVKTPDAWTLEALCELEWKRFELLWANVPPGVRNGVRETVCDAPHSPRPFNCIGKRNPCLIYARTFFQILI